MLREHRRATAEQVTNAVMTVTAPRPLLVPQNVAGAETNPRAEDAKDEPEKTIDNTIDEAPAARATQPAPRAKVKPERAKAVDGSAAELFARANLLRRRDEVSEAAAVYRELQRSFPGSAEELLSRVVLGRLLLDRLGEPTAAIVQFDSYLAGASQGSLREEALVGRAVALGRLGRVTEERHAWNALLDAFPRSTSAARARARIGAVVAP
jgi:TolA-binding protein